MCGAFLSTCWCTLLLASGSVFAATNDQGDWKAEIAYLRYTDGYWQVWLTDSGGRFHQPLTSDSVDKTRLSWSRKRQRLLCNLNSGKLIVVDLDGKVEPLDLPVSGMLDAAWSADGSKIAYSINATQTTDNNDLWVINTDGTGARKLTNQPGVVQTPSWHPSGELIAYSLGAERNYVDIWQINLANLSKEQITVAGKRHFGPAYTADGQLLYSTQDESNFEIWERDGDGQTRQITDHPAYDSDPSASPDGGRIAFYSLRNGQKQIWIFDKSDKSVRAITPEQVQSRYPVWIQR